MKVGLNDILTVLKAQLAIASAVPARTVSIAKSSPAPKNSVAADTPIDEAPARTYFKQDTGDSDPDFKYYQSSSGIGPPAPRPDQETEEFRKERLRKDTELTARRKAFEAKEYPEWYRAESPDYPDFTDQFRYKNSLPEGHVYKGGSPYEDPNYWSRLDGKMASPEARAKILEYTQSLPTITSDKQAKTQPMSNNVQNFLDTLKAYSFKYKNPADEPTEAPNGGRYLGVMAQDVEKTPYGQQIVKEDEQGKKYLEMAPLMSALAASVANLNDRVKGVEAKKK